jgi:hypothetical protein
MENDHFDVDNSSTEENNPHAQSESNKIPLWLQGIDNPKDGETKPNIPDQDHGHGWIRELDDKKTEPTDQELKNFTESDSGDDVPFETEIDLQLSIDGEKEGETGDKTTQDRPNDEGSNSQFEDREVTEEIDIKEFSALPDSVETENGIDENLSSEGFVDISGLGLSEEEKIVIDIAENEPLREGQLPEWLQEMIAEAEQESEVLDSEPTIEQENNVSDWKEVPDAAEEKYETTQEETVLSDQDDMLDSSVEDGFDLEYALSIAKQDTEPVVLIRDDALDQEEVIADEKIYSQIDEPVGQIFDEQKVGIIPPNFVEIKENLVDTSHELSLQEEEVVSDKELQNDMTILDEEIEEISTTSEVDQFLQVKEYLDQDRLIDALPTVKLLLEKSAHLEELEELFLEYSDQHPQSDDANEILGDIAFKRGSHALALKAYTKAISILLNK